MTVKKMISYRSVWMGFAMLWVIVYHVRLTCPIGLLQQIKSMGYAGVDIFLFAAGIGNYYSYFKDESPLDFLKRRIKRLAPTYVPFMVVWCLVKVLQGQLDPMYIAGNLLGVQGFSESGIFFNWYLTCLVICYLLTPYLGAFVRKNSLKKNLVLMGAMVLLSTAFWNDTGMIVSFARLPLYVAGMICAKYDEVQIRGKHVLAGGLFCGAGLAALFLADRFLHDYLWPYGLFWYPFILIAPFLCYGISVVSAYLERWTVPKWLLGGIRLVGNRSFELYLSHVFVFDLLYSYLGEHDLQVNLWIAAASVGVSFLLVPVLKGAAKGVCRCMAVKNEV